MLAAMGCSNHTPKETHNVVAVHSDPDDELRRDADLIVGFVSWQVLYVDKPKITDGPVLFPLTKEAFLEKWSALTTEKKLALVIFSKASYPSEEVLDEVESFFKGLGFRRVVAVHYGNALALPGSRPEPPLRETSRPRSP
jgi:hypothetical protein